MDLLNLLKRRRKLRPNKLLIMMIQLLKMRKNISTPHYSQLMNQMIMKLNLQIPMRILLIQHLFFLLRLSLVHMKLPEIIILQNLAQLLPKLRQMVNFDVIVSILYTIPYFIKDLKEREVILIGL